MQKEEILNENIEQKKERAKKIVEILRKTFPNARCELDHKNPFELLVVVLLSAQSTDKKINEVSPKLFKIVPTPEKMANISQENLEKLIHSTGFFRQKAKNLIALSKMIVEKFDRKVPNEMEKLIELPGIARKSANIILETGFKIVEGIAVDTHVLRVSELLNLSKNGKNAEKVEKDLLEIFPQKIWGEINHLFVWHGRRICIARRPKCDECPIAPFCSSKNL